MWAITVAAVALVIVLGWQLVLARRRIGELEFQAGHTGQEERELAAQLAEAIRLRDGLLKSIEDAVLVLDPEQAILFANPAAETLLGPALVGKTLMSAIRHSEIDQLTQDAQSVIGEGVERRIEYERHILHVRAVALQDDKGTIEVLSLRDITDIQRLERARREMVSNVSHELSTPITAIGVLADTLLNSALQEKPKKTRKMAGDIRHEVDTLTQLVQEMRDLALIESGQMPVRMTPANLAAIVQASVKPLLPLAENKERSISIEVPEAIMVLADELQIERALKNMIHNAIKFSPRGAGIRISAKTEQDEAVIAISDHGPGIPAVDLPRIFERFYQVDPARRGGTGLGLAIVRHIVLAHGGRVWAESVEGQGATFYTALALATPQPESSPVDTDLADVPANSGEQP
jgi:two-component system phosphate regulon sensor histidine kinase PhoR